MFLYIIRHGETKVNTEGRLCGHIDIPLNDNGRLLAELTGEGLADIAFDEVVSSPLSRAYETAQLILSKNKKPEVKISTDDRLKEIFWGAWEMKGCVPWNYELDCADFNQFWHDPFDFQYGEGGETMYDLCTRAKAVFDELTQRNLPEDYKILVTTHGCTTRALLRNVYEDKTDFWHGCCPANCALNVVEVKGDSVKLIVEDKIFYDPSLCENLFHED